MGKYIVRPPGGPVVLDLSGGTVEYADEATAAKQGTLEMVAPTALNQQVAFRFQRKTLFDPINICILYILDIHFRDPLSLNQSTSGPQ